MGNDEEINDAMLIQAMRRRVMEEIGDRGGRGASVVNNNVYGGGLGSGGNGGIGGGDTTDPSDRDYFVDIMREDLPELNPLTGKPKGWKKSVHRFSTGKKKVTE
jgi:hypothetical protein